MKKNKSYKEFEVNELPDADKKVCYAAFEKIYGPTTMVKMRQMVAMEGPEMAFGRFMKEWPDYESQLQDVKFKHIMNMVYNTFLYIAINNQS